MPPVLITAFEPFDRWKTNASWLALVELARRLPGNARVTTRLYPVELDGLRHCLSEDLAADYEVCIHLGQAAASPCIRLEAIAINLVTGPEQPEEGVVLAGDGPVAFRTQLPLTRWANELRQRGIPACVSHHAGTYLCNAALYLSHYLGQQQQLRTKAALVHVPLEPAQVAAEQSDLPSMPATVTAKAIEVILHDIQHRSEPPEAENTI
jgi:pyroglutamyl-peptidase